MKAKAIILKLFLHDIYCHYILEHMTFDIIGRHFTANTSFFIIITIIIIIVITYGPMTSSSVQRFPYIELFVVIRHNIKTDSHK